MKNIKVKVQVIVPTTFELEITDKKLWKKRKDEFYNFLFYIVHVIL